MEYPEMYYIFWWEGEPSAFIRFTPEKDISGGFFVDKEKRHEVLWAKNKTIREWRERTLPASQYRRNEFTENKGEIITWIFGGEPR